MFSSLEISASGLSAQRLRMDIIADNIANATTTRPAGETPYYRRYPVFDAKGKPSFSSLLKRELSGSSALGVTVASIAEDRVSPGDLVYDPGHPHANASGYVQVPNVNVVNEMVDMISASRAYEANVTAMNATKAIISRSLEIGR